MKANIQNLKQEYSSLKSSYLERRIEIKREQSEKLESLKDDYRVKRQEIKDPLKAERLKERIEKRRIYQKLNEPPKRTTLEEIGNSVTHGVGSLLGIYFLVIMILASKSSLSVIASSIYGACFILQMLFSCLYHSFPTGSKVKRIFRRFDYSSIYLQLAGTFTPLLLIYTTVKMNNEIVGVSLCITMWSLVTLGITMVSIFGPGRIRWLHYTLYFLLGWSGIVFLPYWIINKDYFLLMYILLGGVIYSLGMIPFGALRGRKVTHFIWHFVVLTGAIVQFVGIYLYVIPL